MWHDNQSSELNKFDVLLFVPVEVDAAAAHHRPGLVDVIDLDDAVKISDATGSATGSKAAARQEMEAQHSA